jgi:hypothetical protein
MNFQIKIIYNYIMDNIDDYLELLLDGFEVHDVIKFIEKDLGIKCIKIKNNNNNNKYRAS